MKPWEKYQVASNDTPSGKPWEKYKSPNSDIKIAKTIQEMHPSVSAKQRAILKNFANSPESGLAYLQQELPGHDVDFQDGQYRVRKNGEGDFKVVDPDTGFFSKDFLYDVGDVAYNVGAGAAEGLAAAGGALVGSLPGAALAGGATSAGFEAARQKLGQYLGIPQEVDATDVAVSGGIGALAPGLTGAGAKKGLVQKGYEFGRNKVAPLVGSKMSGISPQNLLNYAKHADKVDNLSKEGIEDYAGKQYDEILNFSNTQREDAAQNLINVIDGSGKSVNVAPAKESFNSPIRELEGNPLMTVSDQGKVAQMRETLRKYLGRASNNPDAPEVLIPDLIPAKDAWRIQKDLKQAAKFGSDMSPEDLYSKGTARDAYFKINKGFEDAIGDAAPEAKRRYADTVRFDQEILPKFEGPTRLDSIQKTYNTLSSLDKNSKRVFQERLNSMAKDGTGLDLTEASEVLGAYKYLGKPSLMPISSGGTTSTSRTIPLALVGGSLGSLAGYQSGGGYAGATAGGIGGAAIGTMMGSPSAMRNYIKTVLKAESMGRTARDRISNAARQLGIPEESLVKEAAKYGLTTEGGKGIWEQVGTPYYLQPNQ